MNKRCQMLTILTLLFCLLLLSAQALARTLESDSDDAQTVEEEIFHAEARAFVIRHVEPNKLRVGGREFRVKRNPVGEGCFVYHPRTRFYGVKRLLVWWVSTDGTGYALNSPAKMVTPGLPWPREGGVNVSTSDVVHYVFEGKPLPPSAVSRHAPARPDSPTFTVKEYRIYRGVIDYSPVSEADTVKYRRIAKHYGISAQEVHDVVEKVQTVLSYNGWFGAPVAEIRHASDWNGEKP